MPPAAAAFFFFHAAMLPLFSSLLRRLRRYCYFRHAFDYADASAAITLRRRYDVIIFAMPVRLLPRSSRRIERRFDIIYMP